MENNMMLMLDNVKMDAMNKFDAEQPVEKIFETLAIIYRMAMVARKEGLLSVEESVYRVAENMLEDILPGTQFLVDGVEPELLAELMTNEYWRDRRQGNDALVKFIMIRGLLLIQQGINPRMIQDILLALLPQQLHPAYKKYVEQRSVKWSIEDEAGIKKRYEEWKKLEFDKEDVNEAVRNVEEKLIKLNNKDVQRVLREIDMWDLSRVMAVFSEEVRGKVFKNVSERFKIMLMEELMNVTKYSEKNILGAAKRIIDTICSLERYCEIGLLLS